MVVHTSNTVEGVQVLVESNLEDRSGSLSVYVVSFTSYEGTEETYRLVIVDQARKKAQMRNHLSP